MRRAANHLIEEIKRDIQEGVLRPGDQLEEAALAERFGVSRTPVREAVRSLVDSGLLETRSRKGAFVRILSVKELIDLFEVAAELEGMASRLAAERLTDPQAGAIQEALKDCEAAEGDANEAAYSLANLKFHSAIHDASGNARLIEQLKQLEGHINPYRSMPYQMRGRLAVSLQEHAKIYETILAGNGEEADRLMRDHMMMQGKRLPILLQTLGND